jgi:hypothetical protein
MLKIFQQQHTKKKSKLGGMLWLEVTNIINFTEQDVFDKLIVAHYKQLCPDQL